MKIAVDPGHGKAGTGARGRIDESAQAWKFSNYLVNALMALGLEAVLTRTQNERPTLEERADRAKKKGCSALISIHFNAGGGDGAEVYPQYFGDKALTTESRRLGESVLAAMISAGQQSRGLKYRANSAGTREYYGILYYPRLLNIASILLELAFVDSRDAEDFDTDAELERWAKVVAGAVADMYEQVAAEPSVPYSIVIEGTGTRAQADALLARVRSAGFPAILKI